MYFSIPRYADISDSCSYCSEVDDVLIDRNSYVARVNYTRQAQDELSVNEGQVVYVVDDSDKSESFIPESCPS